jgi:hypothetical protein
VCGSGFKKKIRVERDVEIERQSRRVKKRVERRMCEDVVQVTKNGFVHVELGWGMYKNVCGRERERKTGGRRHKKLQTFSRIFFPFQKRREIIRDFGGGLLLYVKIPRGERKR